MDNQNLDAPEKEEFLGIIAKESERITRLINQVLDLEKVQKQPPKEQQETLSLTEVVRQAQQSLVSLMEEKSIQCFFLSDQKDIIVEGNRDQLTQVAVNLLSNAIKFCHPTQGRIWIRLIKNPPLGRLEIEDNGKGISPSEFEVIFEKFTQLNDRERGKPKGSGLGLFICKTIIEQHLGRIYVESPPGKGARFCVELPLFDYANQTIDYPEKENNGNNNNTER